ncbi:MAG: GntR family transcriptional regulator [Phycisphaeraceae bacterium]|nr:GntR family transcriptional regulator [Phycisphaeraceae bacterium]
MLQAGTIADHPAWPLFQQMGEQLVRHGGPPLYEQVREAVRAAIAAGKLKPGEQVPTQRDLSARWGIGEVTIRRAFQELAREGQLVARTGSGTVVREGSADPTAATRTLTVGVAFADLADGYPFMRPLLEGLRDTPRFVAVRFFDLPADGQQHEPPRHSPSLIGLDGLVMMSPVNLSLLAAARQKLLPCVLLFSDIADGYSRCVVIDYARGVQQTIKHLKLRGARKIALVTAGPLRFSTGQLVDAYHDALELHGLRRNDSWLIHAGYEEAEGYRATKQLLAGKQKPDAILFASDYQARGGLLAAHDLSVRVPKDLRIVGAGRHLGPDGWSVPLTSIDLRVNEAGRLARSAIEQALLGETAGPYRLSVPSQLVEGRTS